MTSDTISISHLVSTEPDQAQVAVPINYAGKLWGWPRRFEARLRSFGSDAVLVGPTGGGLDDAQLRADIPNDFAAWVWTNEIETLYTRDLGAVRIETGSNSSGRFR
jgi:hypothetical protein